MLAMIALVLGSFTLLVVRSYRQARAQGGYQPEGKLRWTDETAPKP